MMISVDLEKGQVEMAESGKQQKELSTKNVQGLDQLQNKRLHLRIAKEVQRNDSFNYSFWYCIVVAKSINFGYNIFTI